MEKIKNENNFFKLCELVRKSVTVEKFKNFCNLDCDQARFMFIHNLETAKNLLNVSCEYIGKDLLKAEEFKKNGNSQFQAQKWINALNFYNESYFATPAENEREISIILANRSAALYHMKQYDLALNDIKRTLKLNYPEDMQYKVKERAARCILAQDKFADALVAFKEALHAIDKANITVEKRSKMETDVQVMIKILQRKSEMESKNTKGKKQINLKKDEKNDIISDSVMFDYTKDEGRFARAKKEIKVGEIIISEKPHCSVILETFMKTHCQNCFKRSIAPVVCSKCSHTIFCSESCLEAAKYHHIECGILPTFWRSGASITCYLALRIMSQKSNEYFLEIKSDLNDSIGTDITDKLSNDDYRRVYKLVRHESKRSFEDFFQRSVMAYFLTCCLKAGNFFNGDETNLDFIGSLILRNLQILQFNAHEVAELQQKDIRDYGKSIFIGAALYPKLALLNHSCDPGVVRYYNGNSVVVRAIKNIRNGEIIAENYGPIFTENLRDNRRKLLNEQYWFDCLCKACDENWPLFKDMNNSILRFRCDSDKNCTNILLVPVDTNEFMFKCVECGESTNILKGLKAVQDTEILFRTANRLLENTETPKALLKFIEMLNIMDETLAPPFKDFHLCQQGIRRCMLEFGNRHLTGNIIS